MMTAVVCFWAAIIALAIPSLCVCSFIFGWGDFVKAVLVLATILDCVLLAYAMSYGLDND